MWVLSLEIENCIGFERKKKIENRLTFYFCQSEESEKRRGSLCFMRVMHLYYILDISIYIIYNAIEPSPSCIF